jgi:hypothetical protein
MRPLLTTQRGSARRRRSLQDLSALIPKTWSVKFLESRPAAPTKRSAHSQVNSLFNKSTDTPHTLLLRCITHSHKLPPRIQAQDARRGPTTTRARPTTAAREQPHRLTGLMDKLPCPSVNCSRPWQPPPAHGRTTRASRPRRCQRQPPPCPVRGVTARAHNPPRPPPSRAAILPGTYAPFSEQLTSSTGRMGARRRRRAGSALGGSTPRPTTGERPGSAATSPARSAPFCRASMILSDGSCHRKRRRSHRAALPLSATTRPPGANIRSVSAACRNWVSDRGVTMP